MRGCLAEIVNQIAHSQESVGYFPLKSPGW